MGRKRVGGRSASQKSYSGRCWTCSEITQPGAFASMTTVTGLPSTPSRNAIRQPQARRAWVKAFNMMFGSYYRRRAPIRLKQRRNLPLDLLLCRDTGMFLRDHTIAANDHGHGDAEQWSERFLHVLASVAHEHRVIHLELSGVGQQLLRRVIDRQAENHEIVLVLLLALD